MTRAKRPRNQAKDLPPKSTVKVKGGRIALNDNITLVRVA